MLTHEDLVFGQRAARLPAQSDERFGQTQNRDRLSAVGNQRQRSRLFGSPDQFARGLMKLFDGQHFIHHGRLSLSRAWAGLSSFWTTTDACAPGPPLEPHSLFGHRLEHLTSLHCPFAHHLIRQILALLARRRDTGLREELGTDTSIRTFQKILPPSLTRCQLPVSQRIRHAARARLTTQLDGGTHHSQRCGA